MPVMVGAGLSRGVIYTSPAVLSEVCNRHLSAHMI